MILVASVRSLNVLYYVEHERGKIFNQHKDFHPALVSSSPLQYLLSIPQPSATTYFSKYLNTATMANTINIPKHFPKHDKKEPAQIADFEVIASYKWMDEESPTILVPGQCDPA